MEGVGIWKYIPMPALSEKALIHDTVGVYTFRLVKGTDLFDKTFYLFETRNILGFLDDFCDKHTREFAEIRNAMNFYMESIKDAEKEAERLREKQERRINEWKKKN